MEGMQPCIWLTVSFVFKTTALMDESVHFLCYFNDIHILVDQALIVPLGQNFAT